MEYKGGKCSMVCVPNSTHFTGLNLPWLCMEGHFAGMYSLGGVNLSVINTGCDAMLHNMWAPAYELCVQAAAHAVP